MFSLCGQWSLKIVQLQSSDLWLFFHSNNTTAPYIMSTVTAVHTLVCEAVAKCWAHTESKTKANFAGYKAVDVATAILLLSAIECYTAFRPVQRYYYKVLFVGLFFIVPCTDQFIRVDLRTVSFDIPPQEVSSLMLTLLHHAAIFTVRLHVGLNDVKQRTVLLSQFCLSARPSVRLSVCLSDACIVTKLNDGLLIIWYHTKRQSL